jgi:hypothetical protein
VPFQLENLIKNFINVTVDKTTSAMDVGDVQFRIGLIISVIVLGSVFAGAIHVAIDEDGGDEAERIAGSLRDAFGSLSSGGAGGIISCPP